MKQKVIFYLEENIWFGRDPNGKNKMLYAFQPLRVIGYAAGADYLLVKPCGRGNYRAYLVKNSLLKTEVK